MDIIPFLNLTLLIRRQIGYERNIISIVIIGGVIHDFYKIIIRGDGMKKKIIVGSFLPIIFITAIIFIILSVYTYNYEMTNDDGLAGFGAVVVLVFGAFVVFYELDLLYTTCYFFLKPKTIAKSVLVVVSNLTLLSIIFTNDIAHFLYKYVSEAFGEELIVFFVLFFIYVILRIVCAKIPVKQLDKENV